MKDVLDALPDALAPELVLEREHEDSPVIPPDDDDVIRPDAEEELLRIADHGSLVNAGSAPLAKHLIWTFGPHHRDFPFMLQLRVEIEGDRLISVDPEIGWHHQGLEKGLENVPVEDAFPLVARLHPRGPAGHVLAFALAVERLLGIDNEVPERAQLWRCVALELTRIREHLHVLSSLVIAHSERRSQRAFYEAARRLDTLVDLGTRADSVRLLWRIGGLGGEVPPSVPAALERALPEALAPIQPVGDRLWQNPAFVDGLAGLGVLAQTEAITGGVTGPALRACGVAADVRLSDAPFAYQRVAPRVVTHEGGDTLARFAVRLDELAASSALVVRALAAFSQASGPATPDPDVVGAWKRDKAGHLELPAGSATASLELPSGELSVLLAADGSPLPLRVRVRGPSFPLAAALPRLLAGARLDDAVPILRSLGISGPELDR